MKLRFRVNPYYLLAHSVEKAHDNKPFPQWVKLAEKIKSRPGLAFKNSKQTLVEVNTDKQLSRAFRQTESTFLNTLKTSEFERLLRETENYRDWVAGEWDKSKDQVLRVLQGITGLKFPDGIVTVIITHPKLSNGSSTSSPKIIYWGHPEEWENYTIVYLCHELLHILTHKKYSNEKIMHAIIELAADNELRIQLNRKGVYFQERKLAVGHSELRGVERRLLPAWKQYLRGNFGVADILDFEKKAITKLTLK